MYSSFSQMCDQLRRTLHRLIHDQHLLPGELAVLTPRRSKRTDENLPGPPSELAGLQLGNFELTGVPPADSAHILTKSIYSFKGLERPVVIIAEIDDQIPDSNLFALLYTATSRAKSHLVLLVSATASFAIQERLGL